MGAKKSPTAPPILRPDVSAASSSHALTLEAQGVQQLRHVEEYNVRDNWGDSELSALGDLKGWECPTSSTS